MLFRLVHACLDHTYILHGRSGTAVSESLALAFLRVPSEIR